MIWFNTQANIRNLMTNFSSSCNGVFFLGSTMWTTPITRQKTLPWSLLRCWPHLPGSDWPPQINLSICNSSSWDSRQMEFLIRYYRLIIFKFRNKVYEKFTRSLKYHPAANIVSTNHQDIWHLSHEIHLNLHYGQLHVAWTRYVLLTKINFKNNAIEKQPLS